MRLVTAEKLAGVLSVTRSFVYEHSAELGALRLGSGPRAPLRFDVDAVLERVACHAARESEGAEASMVEPIRRRRHGQRLGTNVELLPVRGRDGA
jgi:hypothetical protein